MTLLVVAVLITGVIVLTPLSDRLRVPSPVLLTVFGLIVPLLPWTPQLRLDPDIILPVVLPPLLFAATQRSTAIEFRREAQPILLLAVGLTVATTAAVAVAAHGAGLAWGPAWVLGAVVSPPDPVAATAVARRLRLPDRIVTVLEGEGMFNDATALVLYALAVSAVVSGSITAGDVALQLVLAVVGGIAVGLVAGWLTKVALGALHDASAETTLTIAMPFATYLLAEQVEGSGVLAVLTIGLYLRSYGHPALTSGGWLLGRSVWRYADYLITSLVFVLIGFELTAVLKHSPVHATSITVAAVTVGVLVALRFAWMFGVGSLAHLPGRRPASERTNRRELLVLSWAGMRGVVTVAAVLALPMTVESSDDFPQRPEIVFVALTCVLVTLVVQGLSLSPLVRALNVGTDADTADAARELRHRAVEAALQVVRDRRGQVPEAVCHAVTLQYEGRVAAQDALRDARTGDDDEQPERAEALQQLLAETSEAERSLVVRARRSGEVSAEVADDVLTEIEARALREID
ncbi:MAG TPA: Na+/H+ antiporter [Angustibacter sp.]|nr:Na+/H+ antiporter [Angustibacter sp.]